MLQTLKKYQTTALMSAIAYIADSPLFTIDYLLRLIRAVFLIGIWKLLFQGRGDVEGYTLSAILTYIVIAEVFAEPLECVTELSDYFWNGEIINRFLRPMTLVGQLVSECFGKWGLNFMLFSIPLLILATLMGVNPLPASPWSAFCFMISLALGMTVGFALEFLLCAIAVSLEIPAMTIQRIRYALGALLGGTIIPLALLPWGMGQVFSFLPFASLASAPLQIYVGRGNTWLLLGLQCFWAVVLWVLALYLWNRVRERIVGYGG